MRVLLIRPVNRLVNIIIPNLGLGYLATALRRKEHNVTILDCVAQRYNLKDFRRYLSKNDNFDVVGFQVFSCDLSSTKESIKIVRDVLGDSIVILGGPHPSAAPKQSFNYFSDLIDYLFLGESEISLPLLLRYLEGEDLKLDDIPGLAFKKNGDLKINKKYIHDNIDDFDWVAWDLINPKMYPPFPHGVFVKEFPSAPIITSRGCPFFCTFCAAVSIVGRKLRYRSLKHVLQEIKLLIESYRIREIHIEDDNFTFDRAYALEFCEGLINNRININWSCPNGLRADTLDYGLLRVMKEAGCYSIAIGIESGSEKILKHMKKNISKETVRKVIDICQKIGIKITGFFILGYPTESISDIYETIRFSKDLNLDRACFANFFPLPGSEIFRELNKDKNLDNCVWDNYLLNKSTLNSHPYISSIRLKWLQRIASLSFYLQPRVFINILKEIKSWRHFCYILRRIKEIFL